MKIDPTIALYFYDKRLERIRAKRRDLLRRLLWLRFKQLWTL